jgi:hypothetical protein
MTQQARYDRGIQDFIDYIDSRLPAFIIDPEYTGLFRSLDISKVSTIAILAAYSEHTKMITNNKPGGAYANRKHRQAFLMDAGLLGKNMTEDDVLKSESLGVKLYYEWREESGLGVRE